MIALIAAVDEHLAIGKNNTLPWYLPDDLKRFKSLTLGSYVLMGRRTALSIGRSLLHRHNLVLTHSDTAPYAGQQVVHSIEEACACTGGSPLMVIGGGNVYRQTLPLATHLYLTWVDTEIDGADTFFPDIDFQQWKVTKVVSHNADASHRYAIKFVDYEKL